MDDIEQYKMSLIKGLECIKEYYCQRSILDSRGELRMYQGGVDVGFRIAIESIKKGIFEPKDYSSDLDILLIEKDKQ